MADHFAVPAAPGAVLRRTNSGATVPIVAWAISRITDEWTATPIIDIKLPPGSELLLPVVITEDEKAGAA
jgi:hypothetical protein